MPNLDFHSDFAKLFAIFEKGLMSLPIDLPGTAFRKATNARDEILSRIRVVVEKRLEESKRGLCLEILLTDTCNGHTLSYTHTGRHTDTYEHLHNHIVSASRHMWCGWVMGPRTHPPTPRQTTELKPHPTTPSDHHTTTHTITPHRTTHTATPPRHTTTPGHIHTSRPPLQHTTSSPTYHTVRPRFTTRVPISTRITPHTIPHHTKPPRHPHRTTTLHNASHHHPLTTHLTTRHQCTDDHLTTKLISPPSARTSHHTPSVLSFWE